MPEPDVGPCALGRRGFHSAPMVDQQGERDWHVVVRWSELEGEQRAAALRIVGVLVFYVVQLLNRYGLHVGALDIAPVPGVDAQFHQMITGLAVAWVAAAAASIVALRAERFPSWLKYVSTGVDFALLASMLCVADGPSSPLVPLLYLLLVLSVLRLSRELVRFATAAAIVAYLAVIGFTLSFRRELMVPPHHQILVCLGLLLTGVVLQHALGRARVAAEEYAARRERASQRRDA